MGVARWVRAGCPSVPSRLNAHPVIARSAATGLSDWFAPGVAGPAPYMRMLAGGAISGPEDVTWRGRPSQNRCGGVAVPGHEEESGQWALGAGPLRCVVSPQCRQY